LVFRTLRGVSCGTGEQHKWWRRGFRSRQRRNALATRVPIFFSRSTHVLDASADMAAETLSGHFGGGISAPVTVHAAD